MGRPWWPGGRPCGSRAAGYALDALDAALVALTLRRIGRIAHHCLRRLEPAGEKEGGEGILRHRAPRLLITDAGEEGRVCHLGAGVRQHALRQRRRPPAWQTRSSELERCAAQLHRLAGRHGRRPNCNGLHVARPTGRPEGLRAARPPGRPEGRPDGRPAGPAASGRPSKKGAARRAARRAARAGPKGGQGRASGPPTGPPCRPHHSVKCAGSSKTSSGHLFLPIFFGVCVKDALFLPPRCPPPPPQAHQRPRPVKATTYRPPVPTCSQPLIDREGSDTTALR